MARIVQKFGGTSVGTIERIKNAAQKTIAEVNAGHEVVVVVSAMAGVTNQLVEYCRSISPLHDAREYDTIVSSGEQVTSGLLAMVLQEQGISARSWMGWQIPLKTNDFHINARISDIDVTELEARLKAKEVPVIAGFQGVSSRNRITTLGRGGSDTSAVAIAAALKADRCDIYTDVDGIYTTDPRLVPQAQKLHRITCEEMLEMASLGAKVLQTRSVEIAMKHSVSLQVLSSFGKEIGSDLPGTMVINEENIMEDAQISGITYARDEAKITLIGLADTPGTVSHIFTPLAEAGINIDMIVQTSSHPTSRLSFTVSRADMERTVELLEKTRDHVPFKAIESDPNVTKISIVGVGMRSHTGVAKTMFQALADKGINIQVISTSEIKISVLIEESYLELAVRALHTAYGLDKTDS